MTKRLSEQLADLSVRAKSAEQALDAAEKEAHDKIVARKGTGAYRCDQSGRKGQSRSQVGQRHGDQKLERREGEDCRRHEPLESQHRAREA